MEPLPGPGPRSAPPHGPDPNNGAAVLECLQLGDDDIGHLISAPPENGSSFTALLELPANQAVELLHSPESSLSTRPDATWYPSATHRFNASTLTLLTNSGLIERAARFSVFANVEGVKVNGVSSNNNNNNNNNCNNKNNNNSPETSSMPSNFGANLEKAVKCEPTETESCPDPSQPLVSDPTVEHQAQQNQRPSSVKRKEREKKAKGSSKKSKNESSTQDGQTLPYVHVRARRGQATDSHSLAERARREKINARMKLLQELVPGCNKISGTALVLDEIINHVQSLQRQVEILSMRLAAVNPRIDFDLDSILATESGSITESNFPGMVMPLMWPEVQVNGNRQQYQQQWHFDALHQPVWGREEDSHNFITPETSLLSYDSSANSASLHSNQLKMEL